MHANVHPKRSAARHGLTVALLTLFCLAFSSGLASAASPALAQYGPHTPPKSAVAAASATQSATSAGGVVSAKLPFTGLALWQPAAFGLLLLVAGISLVTVSRRRRATI